MLGLLLEAAFRSFLLGGGLWLGLKLLRVRSPQAKMTIWTVALMACLAMPVVMNWRQAPIPAVWPLRASFFAIGIIGPAASETAPLVDKTTESLPDALASPSTHTGDSRDGSAPVGGRKLFSSKVFAKDIAVGVYVVVGGALLARLLLGVGLTWRLLRQAEPVAGDWTAGWDVRLSHAVGAPVTFGSTIVLPAQCLGWSPAKRLAVLAHEKSHVAHGDFYLLLLGTIHRDIFWFSPFSWWLLNELAQTAELVSDDAAIEAVGDRPAYAEILLEFARCGRREGHQRLSAAVGMARTRTAFQRVERVLAAPAAPARLGGRTRALIAVGVTPLAAVTTMSFAKDGADHAWAPDAGVFAAYVGRYQPETSITVLTVTAEADRLFLQETGKPKLALSADKANEFSNAAVNVGVTFSLDRLGQAAGLVLKDMARGSRRARRMNDAEARGVENSFTKTVTAVAAKFKAQTHSPETKDFLTRHIAELRKTTPNFDEMSPELAQVMRQQAPEYKQTLARLGDVESLHSRGVNLSDMEVFDVKFSNGSAVWMISLGKDRKIRGSVFHLAGDATPGAILACSAEAGLKGIENTAPIRMNFVNRSGDVIEAFALTPEGKRKSQGRIEDAGVMTEQTTVGSPWVVADSTGNCLQIILPGQATRNVIVHPARAAGASASLPLLEKHSAADGERVLREYVERILGDDPALYKEAELTGYYLGVLHELLRQFGQLKAISFKGMGPEGLDVYHLEFADGSTDVRMALRQDGRIGSLQIGPEE